MGPRLRGDDSIGAGKSVSLTSPKETAEKEPAALCLLAGYSGLKQPTAAASRKPLNAALLAVLAIACYSVGLRASTARL
jgi:hypothetical protein